MLGGGGQGVSMGADRLKVRFSRPAGRLKVCEAGTDPAPYLEPFDACRVRDPGHRDAVGQGLANTVVPEPEGTPDAAVSLGHLLAVQGQFPAERFLVDGFEAPAPAGPQWLDGHPNDCPVPAPVPTPQARLQREA